jgi:hypothetical protein
MTLAKLRAHGIHAAAITYDARETLLAFGEAYHIAYPLLSDRGSKVIRAFGILNTNIPEDHAMMYGIPWPGNYLIAPDGKVQDKLFLHDYQLRPSAAEVLLRHFGDTVGGNGVEITTDVLQATVTLSTDRCFPGQEIAVALKIRLKPGWHVYGAPLPKHYQAIELTFDSPLVEEPSLKLPPPTPMLLKAVGETLPVYYGEIQAIGTLRIKWSPPMPAPFLEALGARIAPGGYTINGALRFQACSEEICEAPQAITFAVPLQIEAGIPPAPKKPG